jgi:hypothetical protein
MSLAGAPQTFIAQGAQRPRDVRFLRTADVDGGYGECLLWAVAV